MSTPVERYRALADLLDSAFRIPGTRIRFGLDPLIGLIPGVGDALGAGITGYLIVAAVRQGAPRSVLTRMLTNVAIDLLLGLMPVAGDALDVAWRANARNARLLEQYVEEPSGARRASRWFVAGLLAALLVLMVGALVLAFLVLQAAVSALS